MGSKPITSGCLLSKESNNIIVALQIVSLQNPLTYDLTQGIVEQQPTCSKLLDLKEVPTVDIRASYHGENVIVQHQVYINTTQ